jgi:hypothetical protein
MHVSARAVFFFFALFGFRSTFSRTWLHSLRPGIIAHAAFDFRAGLALAVLHSHHFL